MVCVKTLLLLPANSTLARPFCVGCPHGRCSWKGAAPSPKMEIVAIRPDGGMARGMALGMASARAVSGSDIVDPPDGG